MSNNTPNLTTSEVRSRASLFASSWKSRSGSEVSDTHQFYSEFFAIFGKQVHKYVIFEYKVGKGRIDGFWPKILVIEQKSKNVDVMKGFEQLKGYLRDIPDELFPTHYLACNFNEFVLHDRDLNKTYRFGIDELEKNITKFNFMLERKTTLSEAPSPVNQKASELVAELYKGLMQDDHDPDTLNWFIMRLVFCMFGDYTDIFENERMFHDYIMANSKDLGRLGSDLRNVMEYMSVPPENRNLKLKNLMGSFPYLNGEIFVKSNLNPMFDDKMRNQLKKASAFDWSNISPAIFGSLYQAVKEPDERRKHGVHYTTEENILRLINPLFLNNLNAEYQLIINSGRSKKVRIKQLQNFQDKLANITVVDPACGCGNFLVVAYQQLRRLESKVIKELHGGKSVLDIGMLSKIRMNNYYGFDCEDFSTTIAKTSMWMMDHMMNKELGNIFGMSYARIPLPAPAEIRCVDALDIDWEEVLPENITYIIGNPPYGGAKVIGKTKREQIKRLNNDTANTLDYVSGWLLKAQDYVKNNDTRIGYVTTSSICQGEQIGQLWPTLLNTLEIEFAYKPFTWTSDFPNAASVQVVILGLSKIGGSLDKRLLYDCNSGLVSEHNVIPPYLSVNDDQEIFDIIVNRTHKSLNSMPMMEIGSQPIDNRNYIVNEKLKNDLITVHNFPKKYIKPYIAAREFISGTNRWILDLEEADPSEINKNKIIREKIKKVMEFRKNSKREQTKQLSMLPTKFNIRKVPSSNYIFIPRVTTKARNYLPVGIARKNSIPSDSVLFIRSDDLALFGILSSSIHFAWLLKVGGKLVDNRRYSKEMVYHTFPLPKIKPTDYVKIEKKSKNIIDVRKKLKCTIQEMYSTESMPSKLQQAHIELDKIVCKLYNIKFGAENSKVISTLLRMYTEHQYHWRQRS